MESRNQIYTPPHVPMAPLPSQRSGNSVAQQTTTTEVHRPTVLPEQPIGLPVVANEVISSALNSKTKKIGDVFSFLQQGALQIGRFILSVSGDLRISPDGIIARNSTGNTTFALDGTTGDAIFAGTLQAGTIIGGGSTVVIQESSAGNGRIVLYNGGLPSILIGDPNA